MGPIGIILSARHKHSTPAGKSIKHTHSPKQRHIHALSYFSKYAVPSRPIYKAGACNSAASLDPTSGPLHPKQTHPREPSCTGPQTNHTLYCGAPTNAKHHGVLVRCMYSGLVRGCYLRLMQRRWSPLVGWRFLCVFTFGGFLP